MQYRLISRQDTGSVIVIRLADPGTLNALSMAMVEELLDALARLGGEARAVVLTGAGLPSARARIVPPAT